MTLELFKDQARRLKSFLQSNPLKTADLASAKYSACMEAVAAIHGARNWNTLQSRDQVPMAAPLRDSGPSPYPTYDADGVLTPNPEVGPAFRGVRPGQVHYLWGQAYPVVHRTKLDLAHALDEGYCSTVLSTSSAYKSFVQGWGGVSTTPYLLAQSRGHSAFMLNVDMQGQSFSNLLLTAEQPNAMGALWRNLRPELELRTGHGFILVVDRVAQMSAIFGDELPAFLEFLEYARGRGTLIHLVGLAPEGFEPFLARVPADRMTAHALKTELFDLG